ncbi:helix-turn-helix domain-containing protein [Nonomuraea sp. NPDC005650]|uniref:TetR/AcrR family transcriptional regulator n=1 Tax=Nonomuraea sp. NPDC005650 TaxID=3157045 RepID=UPI00339DE79D
MATETERHLRADAARNVERIVRAAHAAFTDDGPDVSLEEIARRAGVGIRTPYRHFPRRGDLIQAVLDQRVAEDLDPKTEGRRRYLGFVLDGLSPATATVQPPAVPVVRNPRARSLFD